MRNLFILFFLSASIISYAQIKDEAKVIDLSFSTSNSNAYSNFSNVFYVQPLIGFAISDDNVLYGGVRYESRDYSNSFGDRNITSLIIGYEKFFELNSKIYFATFLSGSVGFGKVENPSIISDLNTLNISFSPRLHYFITDKWSLVASVGAIEYRREVEKSDAGDLNRRFFTANLNASNVFFGIRLNLNNN